MADKELEIFGFDFPEELFVNQEIDMEQLSKVNNFNRLSEKRIREAIEAGMSETADAVAGNVRTEMGNEGVGILKSAVETKKSKLEMSVTVNDPDAGFIEYGTGIIGSQNKHPDTNSQNWQYDIHGHGKAGWFAPLDKFDPNEYKIVKTGYSYGLTRGIPARPFFYNALQKIKNNGIVTRIFRKEFRKYT